MDETQENINTTLNTNAAGMGPLPDDEWTRAVSPEGAGSLFFQPDNKMLKWLAEYANGRLIIDVGAGTLHLGTMLKATGYNKYFAIEPFIDGIRYRELCMLKGMTALHLDTSPVEESTMFKSMAGKPSEYMTPLVIFARPCHSDFVENAIDLMYEGAEALYITVPENIDLYDDLGSYRNKATFVEHEGKSKDGEVIYSITK